MQRDRALATRLSRLTRRMTRLPPKREALAPEDECSPAELQRRKVEKRDDDASIMHIFFLYADYEPRCLYFVVYECARKSAA